MDPEVVKQLIEAGLPNCQVMVKGDGSHFDAIVVGEVFAGLSLVKQHITEHGMLRIEDLYEAPFTQLHSEGVDGVFTDDAQVNQLLGIIETFDPSKVRSAPMNDGNLVPDATSSGT